MLAHRKRGKRGFTLVELLTVLAIGAVLTAFAIPALANLGLFARDELKGTARDMLATLQAARIYASTYSVNTAVVYALDNYEGIEDNVANTPGLPNPVLDTISGQTLRVIVGMAIMYELPGKSAPYKGGYVPVGGEEGIFRKFQGGMVIPLEYTPRLAEDIPPTPTPILYAGDSPRVARGDAGQEAMLALGLTIVPAYPDGYGPLTVPGTPDPDAPLSNEAQANFNGTLTPDLSDPNDPRNIEYLPAHVFTANGQLDGTFAKERFRFFIIAPPDLTPDQRLVSETGTLLISVPMEITRSSGRVRIATEG